MYRDPEELTVSERKRAAHWQQFNLGRFQLQCMLSLVFAVHKAYHAKQLEKQLLN
jgi:hypothetical protein